MNLGVPLAERLGLWSASVFGVVAEHRLLLSVHPRLLDRGVFSGGVVGLWVNNGRCIRCVSRVLDPVMLSALAASPVPFSEASMSQNFGIKSTFHHTGTCMSTCIPNHNMHVQETRLSTYIPLS